MTRHDEGPAPRDRTIRDAITETLRQGWATAKDLSMHVGISEAAVPMHLEHVRRSLEHASERFEIDPSACIACGYAFPERTKLKKPSRCPKCRSERMRPPRYRVVIE